MSDLTWRFREHLFPVSSIVDPSVRELHWECGGIAGHALIPASVAAEIEALKARAALADEAKVIFDDADVDGSTEEEAARLAGMYSRQRDWCERYDALTADAGKEVQG